MGLKAIVKRMIWLAVQVPLLRSAIIAYYESKPSGWNREHPYDRAHGVRTSGVLPGFVLRPGEPVDVLTTSYAAAQPSIIRTALAAIPDLQRCHFLDLGCGKGRPLLIATEFGFSAITGVEFSPALSRIARRNVAVFSHYYPDRKRINIVTGDALAVELPQENLVVFLYNPFGRPLIAQLVRNIESFLRATQRELYIVYYNPAWADVLDASAALERRYAAQLPYDPGEIGYGPDESDSVVIWQNRGNPHPCPPGSPNAFVTIVSPGWRAEIAEQVPHHSKLNPSLLTKQGLRLPAHRFAPLRAKLLVLVGSGATGAGQATNCRRVRLCRRARGRRRSPRAGSAIVCQYGRLSHWEGANPLGS